MASYGDGIDGAPIPWEIDETGLGIWALESHAGYLSVPARGPYLREDLAKVHLFADLAVVALDLDTFPLSSTGGRTLLA